jgi:hypothetical protein
MKTLQAFGIVGEVDFTVVDETGVGGGSLYIRNDDTLWCDIADEDDVVYNEFGLVQVTTDYINKHNYILGEVSKY